MCSQTQFVGKPLNFLGKVTAGILLDSMPNGQLEDWVHLTVYHMEPLHYIRTDQCKFQAHLLSQQS